MKIFGILVSVGTACLLTTALDAAPFPATGSSFTNTLIHPAAYNGDPYTGGGRRRGGGGGRRHSAASKGATPALPSTKGLSQEGADKEYRKKYGF